MSHSKCTLWNVHLPEFPNQLNLGPPIIKLITPEPLTKSFTTFGLGSSKQLLVANWKKYPHKFHWQRGYLALAMVVRLDKNTLTAIAKAKQPPCQQILLECAIDLQMCFLALAIASKKIQNRQWNLHKVVAIWCSQWNSGFS